MTANTRTTGRGYPLTLADLLTALDRFGYDPDTVTFATANGPVTTWDDDYDISREHGALVVTLGPGHEW